VYNRTDHVFRAFTGADKQTIGEMLEFSDLEDPDLQRRIAPLGERLKEDLDLIEGVYSDFSTDDYLKGKKAPLFFGSALNNFGVRDILDYFTRVAPAPGPVKTEGFIRIVSGIFQRNTAYIHVRTGRQLKFSSPTSFMAEKKSVIDEAYPGDIVGVHDTGNFKIGDAVTEGEDIRFTGIPSFSPELFRYVENDDPTKFKQLAKGLDQLMDEGVAQLFVSSANGRKIIGTVGALQFDVIQYRLEHEYGARCRYEQLPMHKACWIESDADEVMKDFRLRKYQQLAKDKEGREVYMAESPYALQMAQDKFPEITFHFNSEF
jgi:peptide chain release factor 3